MLLGYEHDLDGTARYPYNGVNALVKVEYPDYGEIFEYDRAGNRIGYMFRDTKERYRYDMCNRLIEKTAQSGTSPMISEVYEYDHAGNLIKDGRAAYSYDGFNRNIRTEMSR